MVTTYIILPFVVAKRGGKLVPCPPQKAKDATRAIAAAERMAGQYAGLVVLEESSDPEQDIYAEPRLLRSIGNVPTEMIEAPRGLTSPRPSSLDLQHQDRSERRVHIAAISISSPAPLPLLARAVRAGFPSPADDFVEEEIDLKRLLVTNRAATFLVGSPATAWSARAFSTATSPSSTARVSTPAWSINDGRLSDLRRQRLHGPAHCRARRRTRS